MNTRNDEIISDEKIKRLFSVREPFFEKDQLLIDWTPIEHLEAQLLWHTPLIHMPY